MTVVVDAAAAVPPYEQIRQQLARQINDGSLPVGAKLPTVRALATDIGVAVNTVARAYRELETAQLIETRGRGGTFVASNGDRSRSAVAAAAAEFVRAADSTGLDRAEALAIVRAALGR